MKVILTLVGALFLTGSAFAAGSEREELTAATPTKRNVAAELYDKGTAAADAGKYAEAQKLFQKANQVEPYNPDTLNMLAYSYRKQGKLPEAFAMYDKALKYRAKFPEAREYLGEAHLQAALQQVEILQSYGPEGKEGLEDLTKAIKEAAAKLPQFVVAALDQLLTQLRMVAQQGNLVKLTLGAHRGADKTLQNVFVRPVKLRAGDRLQFVYRHDTRDITKNLPVNEAVASIQSLLTDDFGSAHLFTTESTVEWQRDAQRLVTSRAQHSATADTAHDRPKQRLIDPQAPWLKALRATPDKTRQIDKFVEILSHLIELPKPKIRIVDMGCGKGYLTFAAYDWLRRNGWPDAEVLGVEARSELVELCNEVAQANGFTGLHFQTGTIEYSTPASIDVLVALHACDTATDDAIAKGVTAGASVIIVAPCCHKELRPQLHAPPVLAGALRHGILLERHAEFVTDALRAGLLEWAGYETKVFEFISTEHTAKNLMITAVKHGRRGSENAVRELAMLYGITLQRLAQQLDFPLAQ